MSEKILTGCPQDTCESWYDGECIPDKNFTEDDCLLTKVEAAIPNKFILDPCCGGKMMWVNKNHPNVLYCDIRRAEIGHIKEQHKHSVEPDILIDFRDMPFDDGIFKLVVFDPPHLTITKAGKESIMAKKFGYLIAETWQDDLKKGFSECWQVLEDFGILIFKWNDVEINYKKVLEVIGKQPLFQNILRKNSANCSTYWACFMKIPLEVQAQ